ncbi:fas apoptotic inhibitory molecule 1-like [Hydractinia symbiolongicarpus]|uniref:fas apoptotic inhibitory molecule 1-like n=1 Tax=Hydractinia symbiolongicarpus TaxID=13093 RepID=UPI002550414B|nr:fas apoptotic inhibitory molecule 1-like [Hydractinia symbiolongicarpus]
MADNDVVAVWTVSLPHGRHQVKFEHGTTTGKRVVYVDGKEILRKNWMFKLVGRLEFQIGPSKAVITIDAASGFAYEYTLLINGKPLEKFTENRKKTAKVWTFNLDGVDTRVVLEKDTMDVWVNGHVLETAGEFVDDGTETHFEIGSHPCYIKAVSSGKQKQGIIHSLIVNGNLMPEAPE